MRLGILAASGFSGFIFSISIQVPPLSDPSLLQPQNLLLTQRCSCLTLIYTSPSPCLYQSPEASELVTSDLSSHEYLLRTRNQQEPIVTKKTHSRSSINPPEMCITYAIKALYDRNKAKKAQQGRCFRSLHFHLKKALRKREYANTD